MARKRWVVQFAIALVCIAFLPWNLHAREEIDVLPLQTVKSLAGVVTVNGDPVWGANVVECSSDWKIAIRRTSTDAQGRFTLATVEGRKIYYLQFSAPRPDINPARVPVKISRVWGKKSLEIRLHLGVSTIARVAVRDQQLRAFGEKLNRREGDPNIQFLPAGKLERR